MRWPGEPSRDLSRHDDCWECRVIGGAVCYAASGYCLSQRPSSQHPRFLAAFAAGWFALGTYRLASSADDLGFGGGFGGDFGGR